MRRQNAIFLTAQWRYLAMLNYQVDPRLLAPLVPAGTELDFWDAKTFVSLVGFLFQDTRVRGFAFPFHRNFEEVNLRFYVRRKAHDGWRRGVVFIKEFVPRRAIAFVAKTFYNENYSAVPMTHHIEHIASSTKIKSVTYSWKISRQENILCVEPRGAAQPITEDSEQEFIAEHYWGYCSQPDRSTVEYKVEHPKWRVWDVLSAKFHCESPLLYGGEFDKILAGQWTSAFLAEGSAVTVYSGSQVRQ